MSNTPTIPQAPQAVKEAVQALHPVSGLNLGVDLLLDVDAMYYYYTTYTCGSAQEAYKEAQAIFDAEGDWQHFTEEYKLLLESVYNICKMYNIQHGVHHVRPMQEELLARMFELRLKRELPGQTSVREALEKVSNRNRTPSRMDEALESLKNGQDISYGD